MIRRLVAWRSRTARPRPLLTVRAARIGALAALLGLAVMAVPVAQGWREGRADPAGILAAGAHLPDGAEGWEALRRLGRAMAVAP